MSRLRLLSLVGAFCFGLELAAAQCVLRVTSLRPCDETGKPMTPHLGDRYYGVRVEWTVSGRASSPYSVKFAMADRSWVWKDAKATTPGHYWGFARFHLPLDGKIPISVKVDCDRVSGNTDRVAAGSSGSFTPIPPANTIEYYGARTWLATQTMTVDVPDRSSIDRITYMFAKPTSETFEKILDDPGVSGMDTVPSRPFGYALLREQVSFPAGRKVALTRSFTVRSSSVRGNLKGAMGSWAAYGDLPSTIAAYLKPESTVECHDPQIKLFVDSVLPEGYRRSLSPYEAAKRLFMAVAGRLSYETPADSDALSGLRKHKGDCGTYSSLYVASLRSIGIPARSVCGWRAGKDQWHCWVETYVPGAGWMPQDPTDCNSIWKGNHSSGGFAYCFAIVPDLNSRVVVSRGSTFTTDEGTWHTMQPGQWGIWGDKPKLPTWTSSCSLVPSG